MVKGKLILGERKLKEMVLNLPKNLPKKLGSPVKIRREGGGIGGRILLIR